MRRLALLTSLSFSLAACAGILGDFEVDPAATGSNPEAGSTDAPVAEEGGNLTDAPGGAVDAGPGPEPTTVAVNLYATCATAKYGDGARVTYCWGAQGLGDPSYLGVRATDPLVGGFARPHTASGPAPNELTLDSITGSGGGGWFFGRGIAGQASEAQPYAWGSNNFGQSAAPASDGGTTLPNVLRLSGIPIATGPGSGAGVNHGCAVAVTRLQCWGQNDVCQIRSGTNAGCNLTPPTLPEKYSRAVEDVTASVNGGANYFYNQFAGGLNHSCVVRHPNGSNDGNVTCWGSNFFGQAGLAPSSHVDAPTDVAAVGSTKFADFELAAGENHTCSIVAKKDLFCWGKNNLGQSNPGVKQATVLPTKIVLPPMLQGNIGQLALGGDASCFVASLGLGKASRAVCFGGGPLGRGPGDESAPMAAVAGIQNVQQLSVGKGHACAIAQPLDAPVGTPPGLYCWGTNENKQLDPNFTEKFSSTPRRVVFPTR